MVNIVLETTINAPIERVFNLSRSIDLHLIAAQDKNEKAIAGVTTGLIGLNETVTWEADHMGGRQELTSKIVEYQFPTHFVDEMVEGAFAYMRHIHQFKESPEGVIMTDNFTFKSPFGIFGKIANWLFLKDYMKAILVKKNAFIKEYAESDMWMNLNGMQEHDKG